MHVISRSQLLSLSVVLMNRLLYIAIWSIAFTFFGFVSYGQSLILDTEHPIEQIAISKSGRLHVLTKGKVCLYEGNSKVGNCITVDTRVKEIIPVDEDLFYLYYDNVLFSYSEKLIIKADTFPDLILSSAVRTDSILVGTASGLFLISRATEGPKPVAFAGDYINHISWNNSRTALLGLDSGAVIVDVHKGKHTTAMAANIIRQVAHSEEGSVALLTAQEELVILDADGKQIEYQPFFSDRYGTVKEFSYSNGVLYILSSKGVFLLDNDRQWKAVSLGSYTDLLVLSNSLLLGDNNKIISHDLTSESIMNSENNYSIYSEEENSYWIGRNKEIVHYLNGKAERVVVIPSSAKDLFVSTLVVNDDYVFAGTMGMGLYVFDKMGRLVYHYREQDLNNRNNIIQLKLAGDKLLVCYLNGVTAMDLKDFLPIKNMAYIDSSNYLYCVEPIGDSEFLFGTANGGFAHWKNNQVAHSMEGSSVLSVVKVDGLIYVGTEKNGVYRIEDDYPRQIIKSNKPIYSLHNMDDLLLVTEPNKTYVFDLKSNKSFPVDNGDLDNSLLNGIAADQHYIYVLYRNGVLKLDSRQLSQLSSIGLHLNRPEQFNKPIPHDKNSFRHDENSLSFSFHPDAYYHSQSVTYNHRLLGLDSAWQQTQSNTIDYFKLPPSDYVFQLAQGYGSDYYPMPEKQFQFTIQKPFWMTWWFGLICILSLLGLIYTYIKRREQFIIHEKDRDKERLSFELEKLKNQIDPHFLFNSFNSLIGLIEEDPEKAVLATEQLSQLYRNILDLQESDVVDLAKELQMAEDYFAIHKLRFEDNIELNIERPEILSGKVLFLSTQFLIENAVKHNVINSTNKLAINIYVAEDHLIVSNKKQPKFFSVSKSGYGLENLVKRYKLFSDTNVVIINTEEKFIVKLPLIYD